MGESNQTDLEILFPLVISLFVLLFGLFDFY